MPTAKKRFLGRKCKLNYSLDWDTPSWVHIDTRDTLAVNISKVLEDVTAEDSDGEQWQQAVLNARSVEFSMFYGEPGILTDSVTVALETAFEADSPLVFAISEGDIATTGTKYRKMALFVTTFNDQRDARGVGKVSVTLTPGPVANKPVTLTVSSET